MKIQVLVSTMNQKDPIKLMRGMNIINGLVVNQITKKRLVITDKSSDTLKSYYCFERGLSKSRNRALKLSESDICMIADDDMYYVANYEKIVTNAYLMYPNADIIAFHVDNEDKKSTKKKLKEGRIGFIRSMKLSSVQVTFNRQSVVQKKIVFDERFGAGTDGMMGEENIFLADCAKRGLKIYYIPIKIATLKKHSDSTWFKGYNSDFFYRKGRVFFRMSRVLYPILNIQFAIRKYKLYKQEITLRRAVILLFGMKDKFISDNKK